jgi:hypothetical protein
MKTDEVPQQTSRMLGGYTRACYAVDQDGRYVVVESKGWQVEDVVNAQANAEIARACEAVRQRVQQGQASALEYHMVRNQLTPALLAAYAGVSWWRVRWHLRPRVFARLDARWRERYAAALRLPVAELTTVPDQPIPPGSR